MKLVKLLLMKLKKNELIKHSENTTNIEIVEELKSLNLISNKKIQNKLCRIKKMMI